MLEALPVTTSCFPSPLTSPIAADSAPPSFDATPHMVWLLKRPLPSLRKTKKLLKLR